MISGINCRGSAECSIGPSVADLALKYIISDAGSIDPNRWYNNGDHIICSTWGDALDGACAFLQNTNGAHGYQIKPLLQALSDHGCKACGSVPFRYLDGINDAGNGGWLTVNYVAFTNCRGVC